MVLAGGSDPPGRELLTVTSPTGAVALTIVDGDFQRVAEGVERVEARLPAPAIYEVIARAGPTSERRLVKLEPGAPVTIDDLRVPFPAASPTASTSTTHEYHMDLAHEATRLDGLVDPGDGALVIVLRDVRGRKGPPLIAGDMAAIDVLEATLEPVAGVGSQWVVNAFDACAYLRLALPPGGYAIRRQPGSGFAGEPVLDQSLWVAAGWQTIAFLLRAESDASVAWPSIHMTSVDKEWQSYDTALGPAHELGLWELRNPGSARTLLDLDVPLDVVARNPLLGIVAATAILRRSPLDVERVRAMVTMLDGLLPGHPDVAGLRARLRLAGAGGLPPPPRDVGWPPMLIDLYLALLRLDADEPGTIRRDSPAELIAARLALSGVWTTSHPLDPVEPVPASDGRARPTPEAVLARLGREPSRVRELRPAEPADRRVVSFLASVADLGELDPAAASVGALAVRDVAGATHLPDAVTRDALRRIGFALLPPPETPPNDGGRGGGGSGSTGFPFLPSLLAIMFLGAVALGGGIASGLVRWPTDIGPTPSPTGIPTAAATADSTAPPAVSDPPPSPVDTAPPPVLELDLPDALEFPELDVGGTQEQPLPIANVGTAEVVISELALDGSHPDDFAVDPGSCVTQPLAPGASCAATVTFSPVASGPREAELVVVADSVEPLPVRLLGAGREGVLLFDPGRVTWNVVNVEPIVEELVAVASDGPIEIAGLAIEGPMADEFSVISTDCGPEPLGSGQGCTVSIEYTPPEESWFGLENPRAADLRMESAGGRAYLVPLRASLNIVG